MLVEKETLTGGGDEVVVAAVTWWSGEEIDLVLGTSPPPSLQGMVFPLMAVASFSSILLEE